MNRGRHKKTKKALKGFNTADEIYQFVKNELDTLLKISIMHNCGFDSRIYTSIKWSINNDGWHHLVGGYIMQPGDCNDILYEFADFIIRIKKYDTTYSIKFTFGYNEKIFKYKKYA